MAADGIAYTAADVQAALLRLSECAGGPEGVASFPLQDCLGRWQLIVPDVDSGAVSATTLGHLKALYDYIEAVIISIGAPGTFNVYEACFEALAKIGFYAGDGPQKDLLLQLLEDIHEVYDVLLSCTETYEWVQPGVTGMLRLWMLQVLFACSGTKKMTGRDLMELTDNDVSGVVGLIAFILRCGQAPFEMQCNAGLCLVELTTADSVFLTKREDGAEDWQNQQIAKLTAMLNRHVNGLIKAIIQFDIVDAFGLCICQHQMSHTRTDQIVKSFLTTIHNCLLYCSENQKNLRQHFATQSTIVQDIMVPYVQNILPALFDNPLCGPSLLEWQNLKSTLQTFVVVTFNINVFRVHFQKSDMLVRVCQVPNILAHISMLELLIKLLINIDFTKGDYTDWLKATLQGAFEALPQESRTRLQRRLTSESSMRLPYSKSSIKAFEALMFAFAPPPGEEVATPEVVETRKNQRKRHWQGVKNKAGKKKRLFALQHTKKARAKQRAQAQQSQQQEEEDESSDDDDSGDDMPPLIPASEWEGCLGAADETGVPVKALCQLGGTLMHDPVSTPDGYLFERAALEDWMSQHATHPLTGAALELAHCQDAIELKTYIQSYQLQMLSACQIAPEAFDEPPPPECEPPAPSHPCPAQPAVTTGPSLLGDLPALQKQEAPKKKEKGKIHIESRSLVDCPADMRCAIDGKVMINPIRTPYGHMFEKKTVEKWMTNCGSVCPITGQPLRMEDCAPDAEMKKRIVRFLRGQD